MHLVRLIASELFGLFVDDEFLAAAILVLIAIAGLLAFWSPTPKAYIGVLLVAGCVAIVWVSIMRAARR